MASSSPAEYISHHIQNLTFGQSPDGTYGFAHSAQEATAMGFFSVNVDSLFWSLLTGIVFCGLFRYVAKKVTVAEPTKLQLFVEMGNTNSDPVNFTIHLRHICRVTIHATSNAAKNPSKL